MPTSRGHADLDVAVRTDNYQLANTPPSVAICDPRPIACGFYWLAGAIEHEQAGGKGRGLGGVSEAGASVVTNVLVRDLNLQAARLAEAGVLKLPTSSGGWPDHEHALPSLCNVQ
ncbi:hypothetical protein AK812_SmicGene10994 [Symbiodinium microadriaticum]|uniref:Uncharacterized protein n=1 Tax=Symbiodinium microadriaticum TaxID=2951 RepID=A0A1Q9EEB3_SYMMI|nr:hypothetical protein AK812_SmicGene10994 [Symbiodinium microadriaticum]